MWIDDPYWARAAKFILGLPPHIRYVLAPAELNHLRDGCLPFAFGHLLHPQNCVVVLPKDDVDQLPKAWIENLPTWETLYADEVFVAIQAGVLKTRSRDDDHHLPYMYDRCKKVINGIQVRTHRIDEELSDEYPGSPYALIAAASLTGNAGDRLLAAAAVRFLKSVCPGLSIIVSDGSPDRTLLKGASFIIIGPGGMIYDMENATRLDLMNLANWFGIGYVSSEYQRDLYLLGIGHQTLASPIGRMFLKNAIKYTRMATARDEETASILSYFVEKPVEFLPDMSTLFSEDILEISVSAEHNRIISICGDLRHAQGFTELASWIRDSNGARLRYIIQANEDAESLNLHRASIVKVLGSEFEEVDCRTLDPMVFCRAIATSAALVTTRFHGMMVALMAGIDLLTFTISGDKRERVRDQIGPLPWARFEPIVDDLRNAKKTIVPLIANGRRVPERAVRFDRSAFMQAGKKLEDDLRSRHSLLRTGIHCQIA